MQKVIIRPAGINDDRSGEINAVFRDLSDGAVVKFESGIYYLRENLLLRGKKNITLEGDGAVLVPFYDPETEHVTGSDVLYVEYCDGVTLRGFCVRSEKPTNTAGKIVAVSPEYIDVKFSPSYPISEKTNFLTGALCDDSWSPLRYIKINTNSTERNSVIAGELVATAGEKMGARHEALGGDVHRIYYDVYEPSVPKGSNFTLTHSYYGLSAFVFRSAHNVTVEDVHIDDFGGFCFAILPRSSNFTFRRVRFEPSEPEHRRYSSCADAIHTTGLYGYLRIEDCRFDGIGDDVLNVHAPMLSVKEKTEDKITLMLDKANARFPKRFIEAGDPLYVFDGETLGFKGKMSVLSVGGDEGEEITADNPNIASEHDYIFNYFYMPDVTITGTTVIRSRSRLCIQSGKNVEIYGNGSDTCMFQACIYISVAFSHWREGGIAENVSIHDNVLCPVGEGKRAIWLRINEKEPEKVQFRHGKISIENNRIFGGTVDLTAAESVTVCGNTIKICGTEPLALRDCRNVTISGNTFEK